MKNEIKFLKSFLLEQGIRISNVEEAGNKYIRIVTQTTFRNANRINKRVWNLKETHLNSLISGTYGVIGKKYEYQHYFVKKSDVSKLVKNYA